MMRPEPFSRAACLMVPDLALTKAVGMAFHAGRLEHDPRLYLLAEIVFEAGECALLCDAIAAQPRDDAEVIAMMDRAFAFRCQQQDASDALARLTADGGRRGL